MHLRHPHTTQQGYMSTCIILLLFSNTSVHPRTVSCEPHRVSPPFAYGTLHEGPRVVVVVVIVVPVPTRRRHNPGTDEFCGVDGEEGSERARSQGFGGGGGYRLSIARDGRRAPTVCQCVGVYASVCRRVRVLARLCECSSGATRRRRSARAV